MIRHLSRLHALALLLTIISVAYAQQGPKTNFRIREPNVHAPWLYNDNLTLKITLVNLPGADNAGSYSECSYQVFFIPEDKYYTAVASLPSGAQNPTPDQFPGRLLIAEGTIKKNHLKTIEQRTYTRAFPFKSKVPDAQQTKFARLMTSYSVKVFDAKLNKTVYRSGIFLTFPFDDASDQGNAPARQTLYTSFMISDSGDIYRSQRPRKDGDTNWN
jgi:hypothetical protein